MPTATIVAKVYFREQNRKSEVSGDDYTKNSQNVQKSSLPLY